MYYVLLILLVSLAYGESNEAHLLSLQKKITELENKMAQYDLLVSRCVSHNKDAEGKLNKRIGDFQSCPLYVRYHGSDEDRTIPFDLLSILMAGCEGNLKYKFEKFEGPKQELTSVRNFESRVLTRKGDYGGGVVAQMVKTNLVKDRWDSRDDRNISLSFDHNFTFLPPVVLGKIYEIQNDSPSGALTKSTAHFWYNVIKNERDELVVTLDGDTFLYAGAGIPRTEKLKYRLTCVGKTVAALNELAKNKDQTEVSKHLQRKVYGNEVRP